MTKLTRHEHVEKCKKRARAYYAMTKDLQETMAAFLSDLSGHPETVNHPAASMMLGDLATEQSMFKFIDGFR